MKKGLVIKINKSSPERAHVYRENENSKIHASINFKKDYFDSDVDTKSAILDKHLRKLSRHVGFNLELLQEVENPDFNGTGHAFGTAFMEIATKKHGIGRFIRGKSIYADGKCSTMFSMQADTNAPASAVDIRMLGGFKHNMDKNLQDFILGFADGSRFNVNIILEKVDDKKYEWESVFESMAGSMRKVLEV